MHAMPSGSEAHARKAPRGDAFEIRACAEPGGAILPQGGARKETAHGNRNHAERDQCGPLQCVLNRVLNMVVGKGATMRYSALNCTTMRQNAKYKCTPNALNEYRSRENASQSPCLPPQGSNGRSQVHAMRSGSEAHPQKAPRGHAFEIRPCAEPGGAFLPQGGARKETAHGNRNHAGRGQWGPLHCALNRVLNMVVRQGATMRYSALNCTAVRQNAKY